jgi:hypothetical protein
MPSLTWSSCLEPANGRSLSDKKAANATDSVVITYTYGELINRLYQARFRTYPSLFLLREIQVAHFISIQTTCPLVLRPCFAKGINACHSQGRFRIT